MVALAAGLLAGVAAVLASGAVALRVDPRVAARLPMTEPVREPSAQGARAWRRLARQVGRWRPLEGVASRPNIARLLQASGTREPVEEVLGQKALAAAAGATLAMLAGPPPRLLAMTLGAVGGFVAPDVALARKAGRRRRRADAEVPELLDLLAAASAAGLAAPMALRRASEAVRGPLADELRALAWTVDHGGRWREELRALAERLQLPDLRRAAAAVGRTERLGAPLAESLRDLAAEVRDRRRALATARARAAPVKMLFPLVFLILPAFLLLTVVPVLLVTLRHIG